MSAVAQQTPSAALTVRLQGDALEVRFPYDARLVMAIRRVAGRRWNPAAKCWTVPTASAAELGELASRVPEGTVSFEDGADALIAEAAQRKTASLSASRATDRTDIDIPAPEGLAYLPYQRAGIAYALARPNTLIGDEMGLGKTIQAIGVVNADPSIQRVLVVCPASLKINWKREIEKWAARETRVLIGSGSPPLKDWRELFAAFRGADRTQVLVVNYDILERWYELLSTAGLDLAVWDEAHYLKNPKAKRTQYLLGSYKADIKPVPARRKIALTGTPIPNRPIELWPLVRALAPDAFGSWKYFTDRFCGAADTGFGRDVTGASHLDELQERLRASIMVRRLKKDVLTELPPKRRAVIELPSDAPAIREEQEAFAAMQERLVQLRVAVELAKAAETDVEHKAAVEALQEGSTAAFTELSKLRHAVALAKVPLIVEHLKECMADGRKVILFMHHRDCVARVAEAFDASCVTVTGQTAMDERQVAVDRFQSDGDVQLFIGNIKAAGVGLTLTASSHVVFGELDWVPGNITQAEDRAHRIGQTESVLVQHLVLEGSLDAVMAHRLIAKQEVIDAALDIEHAPREVTPLAAPVPARPRSCAELTTEPLLPMPPKEAGATEDTTRAAIVEEATGLSSQTIAAVHEGLRQLAGLCDGAQLLDGMGFNKIDTRIGHSLAACDHLTPRQAALGQRLCRKYRRQLSAELLAVALGDPS